MSVELVRSGRVHTSRAAATGSVVEGMAGLECEVGVGAIALGRTIGVGYAGWCILSWMSHREKLEEL